MQRSFQSQEGGMQFNQDEIEDKDSPNLHPAQNPTRK